MSDKAISEICEVVAWIAFLACMTIMCCRGCDSISPKLETKIDEIHKTVVGGNK